jgi:hypothetical protein
VSSQSSSSDHTAAAVPEPPCPPLGPLYLSLYIPSTTAPSIVFPSSSRCINGEQRRVPVLTPFAVTSHQPAPRRPSVSKSKPGHHRHSPCWPRQEWTPRTTASSAPAPLSPKPERDQSSPPRSRATTPRQTLSARHQDRLDTSKLLDMPPCPRSPRRHRAGDRAPAAIKMVEQSATAPDRASPRHDAHGTRHQPPHRPNPLAPPNCTGAATPASSPMPLCPQLRLYKQRSTPASKTTPTLSPLTQHSHRTVPKPGAAARRAAAQPQRRCIPEQGVKTETTLGATPGAAVRPQASPRATAFVCPSPRAKAKSGEPPVDPRRSS